MLPLDWNPQKRDEEQWSLNKCSVSTGMLAPSPSTSNLLVDQKNGNEDIVYYKSVPE